MIGFLGVDSHLWLTRGYFQHVGCYVIVIRILKAWSKHRVVLEYSIPAHLRGINDSEPVGEDLTVLSGRSETLCICKRSVGQDCEYNDREK